MAEPGKAHDENGAPDDGRAETSAAVVLPATAAGGLSQEVGDGQVVVCEEASEHDGTVTVRNMRLIGDSLVFMEGGMILTEEGEAIFAQEGIYIDTEPPPPPSDESGGERQHIIAYLPERVPEGQGAPNVETAAMSCTALERQWADEEVAPPSADGEAFVRYGVEEATVPESLASGSRDDAPVDQNVDLLRNGESGGGNEPQAEAERPDSSVPYDVNGDRQNDQELQVVPDSSVVNDKRFCAENLHEVAESVELGVAASSLGVQMVPTLGAGTTVAQDDRSVEISDATIGHFTAFEMEHVQSMERHEGSQENAVGEQVAGGDRESIALQPASTSGSARPPSSLEDNRAPGCRTGGEREAAMTASENLLETVVVDSVAGTTCTDSVAATCESLAPVVATTAGVESTGMSVFFDVSSTSVLQDSMPRQLGVDSELQPCHLADDQTYEVCVTMPISQAASKAPPHRIGGTVSVPMAFGDQVHEIPIDVSDWGEFEEQSLVAVTEDGTAIPLTVLRRGPDGQIMCVPEELADVELASRMVLQQLGTSCAALNVDPAAPSSAEVISMLQSQNGAVIVEGNGVAPTSGPRVIYSDSTISIGEQAILPDTKEEEEEVASLLHIPEDMYLSGQPLEFQVVGLTETIHSIDDNTGGQLPEQVSLASLYKDQQRRMAQSSRSAALPAATATEPSAAARHRGRSLCPPRGRGRRSGQDFARTSTAPSRPKSLLRGGGGLPRRSHVIEQEFYAVEGEVDSEVVELSNTTPSAISVESMQTLIQILQSMPATSRGQTIQIILQTCPATEQEGTAMSLLPDCEKRGRPLKPCKPVIQVYDADDVRVVHMLPSRTKGKTTSDIAIQVSPEFIEEAQPMFSGECTSASAELSHSTVDSKRASGKAAVEPAATVSEDEKMRAFMAVLTDTPMINRRQSKKKNSKQIVTVQEQWVVDPKPGVSYYAVVDYLSEHDHDGFSSATEMRRPEAPSEGFMEDHLELQDQSQESSKNRSILESTVDSSIVVSPFRRAGRRVPFGRHFPDDSSGIDLPAPYDQSRVTLCERTFEQVQMEEEESSLAQPPTLDTIRPRRRRKMRQAVERFEHKCGYCQFDSRDKILVVEHCIREHDDKPVKTLSLLPQAVGRTCPYCQQVFDHLEFFSHMRFAHSEVHPYKCGYCEFMGRDRNQIRHHIQKKHRLPIKVINLLDTTRKHEALGDAHGRKRIMALSEGEDTVYEYLTDEEELEDDDSDHTSARRGLICPECKKTFKTLKYLKTHIKVHQAHRYQCGYCDFISIMLHQVLRHCQRKHSEVDPKVLAKELEPEKNPIVSRDIDDVVKKVFSLNTRLPRDPDNTKWMRKWCCPHCDYTCQFGASYRRHLRMHANILPYKCNYCSFKGREKYYVRRHIHRMHPELPVIVVENTPENCAGDTSSDEDFQEKGLRRKRRRRVKESVHAVVPVEEVDPDSFQELYQMQPIREHMRPRLAAASGEDSQNVPPTKVPRTEDGRRTQHRGSALPRLPRAKEWSGENISDYVKGKEGDRIVCKMCGQKTLAKAFYKHARKHFKVKPFKCGYCNYMSIERAKIRVHNTLKHPNLPFKIEECHLASMAPQDFMDLIKGEAAEGAAPSPSGIASPRFTCPLCQLQVDYDRAVLSEHFFAHFEYYPYECSECGHQNVSEEKVREHGVVHGVSFFVNQTNQLKPEGLDDTILQFLKEGQQQQELVLQFAAHGSPPKASGGRVAFGGGDAGAEKLPTHVFVCPICDRKLNVHSVTVRRHLYSHFGYKPFKCGYCSFLGVSKANVRQHTVTHGSVRPKVDVTDELMPEQLATMLREVCDEMRQVQGKATACEGVVNRAGIAPRTNKGKTWKEKLTNGECPWCGAAGCSQSELHAHLLSHFSTEPYHCAHCGVPYAKRTDAIHHVIHEHPGLALVVDEIDRETVRNGLRRYVTHEKHSETGVRDGRPPSLFEAEMAEDIEPTDGSRVGDDTPGTRDETVPCQGCTEEPMRLTEAQGDSIRNVQGDTETRVDRGSDDEPTQNGRNGNIVTVEGILLRRSFKSETEGSDEDGRTCESPMSNQGRGSDIFSTEDEDDEEFLVEQLTPDFVQDVINILKQSSSALHTASKKASLPDKASQHTSSAPSKMPASVSNAHSRLIGSGPVFVCGYCEFCSHDQLETRSHVQDNHSDKPVLIKRNSAQPKLGGRVCGTRGKRRRKRNRTRSLNIKEDTAEIAGENMESTVVEKVAPMSHNKAPATDESTAGETGDTRSSKLATTCVAQTDLEVQSTELTLEEPMDVQESVGSNTVVTSSLNPGEDVAVENEPDLHPLTPMVPNTEDHSFEALENLEECDENLPKILHILQLRPTRDDDRV